MKGTLKLKTFKTHTHTYTNNELHRYIVIRYFFHLRFNISSSSLLLKYLYSAVWPYRASDWLDIRSVIELMLFVKETNGIFSLCMWFFKCVLFLCSSRVVNFYIYKGFSKFCPVSFSLWSIEKKNEFNQYLEALIVLMSFYTNFVS